jgi:hypothetical protein
MSLQVSRILHAGYVFQNNQTMIAFDPLFENPFSRNCYAFPDVQFDREAIQKINFSAIFISHFHDDHCSFESLNLIDRSTPIYVFCVFDELFYLLNELGFSQVHSLKIDESIVIGDFEIITRRALDAEVDSLFQIKVAGLNILNVVDSWIDEETMQLLLKQGVWDLVLWPFQTMREIEVLAPTRAVQVMPEIPHEWIQQLQLLNPRYVVPSSCQFIQQSWSWYNHAMFPVTYSQFKKEIETAVPKTSVLRLNPSCSFLLDSKNLTKASPLKWIMPQGNQDVDYDYRPHLIPPSTKEIAQHFAALDQLSSEKVFNYCEHGLIEKFRSLDAPSDSYFNQPRIWRLSLFDHLGQITSYFFRMQKSSLEKVVENSAPLGWTTEIPLTQFYAALELGEALTSLYIRINDSVFDEEIEKKIGSIDVIEDPLIRCLFSDVFGAYQKNQLKRLLKANQENF